MWIWGAFAMNSHIYRDQSPSPPSNLPKIVAALFIAVSSFFNFWLKIDQDSGRFPRVERKFAILATGIMIGLGPALFCLFSGRIQEKKGNPPTFAKIVFPLSFFGIFLSFLLDLDANLVGISSVIYGLSSLAMLIFAIWVSFGQDTVMDKSRRINSDGSKYVICNDGYYFGICTWPFRF
jgi:hypothetical protein